MDHSLYPPNWNTIAFQIKVEVNWCCEFCGRACIRPGESVEGFCDQIQLSDIDTTESFSGRLIWPLTNFLEQDFPQQHPPNLIR